MNHHSRGQHGEYSKKFHSMRFLYLVVRCEISEMEIFPSCRCVCVKKNPHRHTKRSSRKCDSAIPEFLCLSVCAVSLNTKILQRAENDEKISLPLQQLPWDFTVLAKWHGFVSKGGDETFSKKMHFVHDGRWNCRGVRVKMDEMTSESSSPFSFNVIIWMVMTKESINYGQFWKRISGDVLVFSLGDEFSVRTSIRSSSKMLGKLLL